MVDLQIIKQFTSIEFSSREFKEQLVNNIIAEGMKLFVKTGGSRNKENIIFSTMSTVMKFLTSRDSNSGGLGELANKVSYF